MDLSLSLISPQPAQATSKDERGRPSGIAPMDPFHSLPFSRLSSVTEPKKGRMRKIEQPPLPLNKVQEWSDGWETSDSKEWWAWRWWAEHESRKWQPGSARATEGSSDFSSSLATSRQPQDEARTRLESGRIKDKGNRGTIQQRWRWHQHSFRHCFARI
jgi:hypothetical protein